jgi:hypothetical protein|tara:strand:- start:254 stop:664 length:411 start_codon:yes stop_codon:yes gene_type:complete
MIEDDFYATIKIKYSGEEIFAKVAASEEDGRTMLLVSNPVCIEEVKLRGQVAGYKFEPWLKTTTEDMFLMNLDDVLTMSESEDIEMIIYYQDYIRKSQKGNKTIPDRKMGYISSVIEAKEILEKIFNIDSSKNINS